MEGDPRPHSIVLKFQLHRKANCQATVCADGLFSFPVLQ